MAPKTRYNSANDLPIEPQSFSMGRHRKWRIKKKPAAKPQTTKRAIARRASSASICYQCNRHVHGYRTSYAQEIMKQLLQTNCWIPASAYQPHPTSFGAAGKRRNTIAGNVAAKPQAGNGIG